MRTRLNMLFLLQALNALLVILLFRYCQVDNKSNVVNTKTEKLIYYDSSKKEIDPSVPPVSVSNQTVPVLIPISDTAAVRLALINFFSVHSYSQQIQDSSIRAEIFDQVSQNRIIDRKFQYQWLKPVKTIESTTVTLEQKKRAGMYMGGFIDYSKAYNSFDFGPKFSFETKKNLIIGCDLGLKNGIKEASYRIQLQQRLKW